MTHILNLIVKDDLKYHNHHIECVQRELWNSTFELLKNGLDLEDVFFEYELQGKFSAHFCFIEDITTFLEKFKTKTEIMSEILDVQKHLRVYSTKVDIRHMIPDMHAKYDKYWGSIEHLNNYTCFAVLLDPCYKERFLSYVFGKMLENTVTEDNHLSSSTIKLRVLSVTLDVVRKMENLFKTYEEKYVNLGSSRKVKEVVSCVVENDFLDEFLVGQGSTSIFERAKSDFCSRFRHTRLAEKNGLRFPIVARMTKDILAIQISTMTSESAFSTSGQILDEYQTYLSTPIVEALVCIQDWIRKSRKPIIDNDENILKDDEMAFVCYNGYLVTTLVHSRITNPPLLRNPPTTGVKPGCIPPGSNTRPPRRKPSVLPT
ncbi:hypothetical protein LXL04_035065 [Taraxacum kok-saghyz]